MSIQRPARVVACEVFSPFFRHLNIRERFPHVQLEFVDANLHLRPRHLAAELKRRLASHCREESSLTCFFGNCAPDIDEMCRTFRARRPPVLHCYEMFLGKQRFAECIEETAGTFFLERDLIRNFAKRCAIPLELHDPWIRKAYFRHYKRLLYVRQPDDADLRFEIAALSDVLELPVVTIEADYTELEEMMVEMIGEK